MEYTTIVKNEQQTHALTDNTEMSSSTKWIVSEGDTQYYLNYINMQTKECFVQAYLQIVNLCMLKARTININSGYSI